MKYVNAIRRIMTIDRAIENLSDHDGFYTTNRWDEIEDRLWDKRKQLSDALNGYLHCPDRTDKALRHHYYGRRKQVQLACKLLGADFYKVKRGY